MAGRQPVSDITDTGTDRPGCAEGDSHGLHREGVDGDSRVMTIAKLLMREQDQLVGARREAADRDGHPTLEGPAALLDDDAGDAVVEPRVDAHLMARDGRTASLVVDGELQEGCPAGGHRSADGQVGTVER